MSYRNNSNQRRSSNDGGGQFGGFRVYVGDIGPRVGGTELKREFGQYGPVTDVWMGKKREANAQDYAFVVFRYPEDADEAVRDRNGRKLFGRPVRVEHAKPIGSTPRRGRGGGWGGGNRDYNNFRGGNNSRRRSVSRERGGSRRSRSQSPVRSSRGRQSPPGNRRRNDSSVAKKSSRRSSSESPEPRPVKSRKHTRHPSSSPSPPPPSRSNQRLQDSDSGNASPSPPPQKKKQRSWSPSGSPRAVDEYDARQYQKAQDEQGDAKKAKPSSQSKGKNYVENDNYSSDDY